MERKQLRLKGWDYSKNGAYFITICTYGKKMILSKIYRRGDPCGRPIIEYSVLGKIADNAIKVIENKFNIKIDKYVIMPNHIHMIIIIDSRTTARVVPTDISSVAGFYKSIIANGYMKECNKRNIVMGKLWQRSYYDHIIRNQQDYEDAWNYIEGNPSKWEEDELY